MFTFQLPVNSGRSGWRDSFPRMRTGERRPGDGQAPAGGAWLPPQGHHLSPISVALWKPWSVVFPHCTVSVISVHPC